jgi:hypothetical protein
MKRPDLDTRACVNPEGQRFRLTGQGNLSVCKVYSPARLRLLRCRPCGEECSERCGTALFNTKIAEDNAASIINHLDEGCGVRATVCLVHVSQDTVARWLRPAGRHAERCHDQRVCDVTPRALECDEQWSYVKKSRSIVGRLRVRKLVTYGIIRRSLPIVSWWSPWSLANAPKSRRNAWVMTPRAGCVPGICPRCSPMPMRAMRPPSWRRLGVVTRNRAMAQVVVPARQAYSPRLRWADDTRRSASRISSA